MDGSQMKELRKNADLTQHEVGIILGVTKQTVYRWEADIHKIHRLIEGRFITLVNDVGLLKEIKSYRIQGVRGRPFVKS